MDKRIGCNLDSIEHAMFNWPRPLPACAKVGSHFDPVPFQPLDKGHIICDQPLHMRASRRRSFFQGGFVLLILLWATAIAPEPGARISITPADLVRAVTTSRASLIELCLIEHVDPNGRDAHGQTPLLIAMSQQNWKLARRFIDIGALVDIADKKGFTPLMAAAMHGNLEMFRSLLAHSANLHAETRCTDGRDLLGMALDGSNSDIIKTVTERLPLMPQWTTSTRRALDAALLTKNKEQIRLLLGRHAKPPTPEGKKVPLLAYAIVKNDVPLLNTLLTCGADPNTVLPARCDKDFLALLPSKSLRNAPLSLKTACRYFARNVRLGGKGTPHAPVALSLPIKSGTIVPRSTKWTCPISCGLVASISECMPGWCRIIPHRTAASGCLRRLPASSSSRSRSARSSR